jgi:hypothetical protein
MCGAVAVAGPVKNCICRARFPQSNQSFSGHRFRGRRPRYPLDITEFVPWQVDLALPGTNLQSCVFAMLKYRGPEIIYPPLAAQTPSPRLSISTLRPFIHLTFPPTIATTLEIRFLRSHQFPYSLRDRDPLPRFPHSSVSSPLHSFCTQAALEFHTSHPQTFVAWTLGEALCASLFFFAPSPTPNPGNNSSSFISHEWCHLALCRER